MTTKTGILFATVKNVGGAKAADGPGEFEAILSTPQLDRDGEILDAGCFEPLPADIPILVDHNVFDVKAVVGRGEPYYDGEVLKVKGRYASTPDGQLVRTLVGEAMVTQMSVNYVNADYYKGDDGVPHLKSGELVESSFVSIPANTDALVEMSKAAKVGARNSATDAERLQQIHDLATENGASCAKADEAKAPTLDEMIRKASDVVDAKSLAGSLEEHQDHLRDGLQDVHPDARWIWLRGTFDDRVVYEVETQTTEGGYEDATYETSYSTNDDGSFTFGTPADVDLAEIVVPAQPDSTTETTAGATAPKAAASTTASGRAAAAMAEAELLLTN
jgi:HK97 family phage prohead protease